MSPLVESYSRMRSTSGTKYKYSSNLNSAPWDIKQKGGVLNNGYSPLTEASGFKPDLYTHALRQDNTCDNKNVHNR